MRFVLSILSVSSHSQSDRIYRIDRINKAEWVAIEPMSLLCFHFESGRAREGKTLIQEGRARQSTGLRPGSSRRYRHVLDISPCSARVCNGQAPAGAACTDPGKFAVRRLATSFLVSASGRGAAKQAVCQAVALSVSPVHLWISKTSSIVKSGLAIRRLMHSARSDRAKCLPGRSGGEGRRFRRGVRAPIAGRDAKSGEWTCCLRCTLPKISLSE